MSTLNPEPLTLEQAINFFPEIRSESPGANVRNAFERLEPVELVMKHTKYLNLPVFPTTDFPDRVGIIGENAGNEIAELMGRLSQLDRTSGSTECLEKGIEVLGYLVHKEYHYQVRDSMTQPLFDITQGDIFSEEFARMIKQGRIF